MKKLWVLPLLTVFFILFSSPLHAVINIVNDISDTPWGSFSSLGDFISTLLPNIYILSGIIMFAIFFSGGFMIISGGTTGDAKKSQQGKEAATWATIGFLVIFASYWILQIIKAITGVDIIHPNI